MKIEKLILENFASINNAMDAKRITIDFTKSKNNICLLIGPNGSGKTSTLSMLQPFADLGNLDVRNGYNLIQKDKDGYKEIVIRRGKDVYLIKHFYTHHKDKSHSVKSYISLNGNELNPNGNVTSFKEIVKIELSIEPDFLKLIRLGANVTSLIGLSATERKTFMGKILDDVGIYLNYYKSVNGKMRQLSDMISHTIDKVSHLGIEDEKKYKKEIKELEKEIKSFEKELEREMASSAIYKHNIESIENHETIRDELSGVEKKYNKMVQIRDRKNLSEYTLEDCEKTITKLNNKKIKLESDIEGRKTLRLSYVNRIDDLQNRKNDLIVIYDKESSLDEEFKKMEENVNSTRLKVREYEKTLDKFKPNWNLSEIERFSFFLKSLDTSFSRMNDYGRKVILKVVELVKANKSVTNYVNSHLIEIDEKRSDKDSFFLSRVKSIVYSNGKPREITCDKECFAKDIFNQLSVMLENSEINDHLEDAQFYNDMIVVNDIVATVVNGYAFYNEFVTKLPKTLGIYFTKTGFLKCLEKNIDLYPKDEINHLITMTTEYENYIKVKEELVFEEGRLESFSRSGNIRSVKNELEKVSNDLDTTREFIDNARCDIERMEDELSDTIKSLDEYEDIRSTLSEFDIVKEKYEKLLKDYDTVKEAREKLYLSEGVIKRLKDRIEKGNEKCREMEINIAQYTSLNNDLNTFNLLYDDMEFVKRSLSSKEGIPLRHIKRCIGNTEEITNELLNIAYNGDIYIDNFEISSTEFSIPFYNRGVRLDDVKYASQGELNFLTIALSFALSSQTIKDYNIMLWDEIDGVLDQKNREKFIEIVENQIARINSEQNFLITHNNMFSSYPVDILDFSFGKNKSEYPMANFIEIERE